MSATIPTARAAHPFLKFRDDPSDMLPSLLWSFNRDSPANPFVAGKWCQIVPFCKCVRIGSERIPQIRWYAVYNACSNFLCLCHSFILSILLLEHPMLWQFLRPFARLA